MVPRFASNKNKNFPILFWLYSFHFLRFFIIDNSGLIYMSAAFHSRITIQNWSKNESQTQKLQKKHFFALEP